jgi:hypothetical protein
MKILSTVITALFDKLPTAGEAEYDGKTLRVKLPDVSPDAVAALLNAIEDAAAWVLASPSSRAAAGLQHAPQEAAARVHPATVAAEAQVTVEDPAPAKPKAPEPPPKTEIASAPSGGVDAEIDVAAERLAAASEGPLPMLKFLQVALRIDPAVRQEAEDVQADPQNKTAPATRRHIERNIKFFPSFASCDDAARDKRTTRSLVGALPAATTPAVT